MYIRPPVYRVTADNVRTIRALADDLIAVRDFGTGGHPQFLAEQGMPAVVDRDGFENLCIMLLVCAPLKVWWRSIKSFGAPRLPHLCGNAKERRGASGYSPPSAYFTCASAPRIQLKISVSVVRASRRGRQPFTADNRR